MWWVKMNYHVHAKRVGPGTLGRTGQNLVRISPSHPKGWFHAVRLRCNPYERGILDKSCVGLAQKCRRKNTIDLIVGGKDKCFKRKGYLNKFWWGWFMQWFTFIIGLTLVKPVLEIIVWYTWSWRNLEIVLFFSAQFIF